MSNSSTPFPADSSDSSPQIQQNLTGDRNQAIGQAIDSTIVNFAGEGQVIHLTIHDRVPEKSAPPPMNEVQPLTQQEYRQRQVLLNKVRDYWIEGVLEKSLHATVLIELGLQERLDLVPRPFSGVDEFTEVSGQALPQGTDATEVFDHMAIGRTLLILGEPGSGKTITLLKLAQDLLARTEADLRQPIPVVLNLSSWARKTQTIAQWLVQELLEKYQVSKALGKTWVETEALILLLDGLDEVKAEQRNACVQALNQFMQTHGTTELVICCRIQDYQALADRLMLRSAICIQPLTSDQIDQYFEQVGEQLASLKEVLRQDEELQGLATSPLMLSIMSLAYQGSNLKDIIQGGTPEDYRQRLFDTYIDRMFQRRGISQRYSPQQSQRWLIWLAQYMRRTSQSVLLIEGLQPDSLVTYWTKIYYSLLNGLIVGGLNFPWFMLPGFFVTGLIFTYLHNANLEQGGSYELTSEIFLYINILSALCLSILVNFFKNIKTLTIEPVEHINWDWKQARQNLVEKLNGLLLVIFKHPKECLMGCFMFNFFIPLFLLIWFIRLLVSTLNRGLHISDSMKKTVANQGISKSRINSLFGVLIGFAIGKTVIFTINAWIDWIISLYKLDFFPGKVNFPEFLFGQSTIAQFSTLIFIVLAGWLGWLNYGGLACTRHLMLRVVLTWSRVVPWNYAAFLDYAADRLFLQKVSGGYIFVHRMLLEHFAAMPLESGRR